MKQPHLLFETEGHVAKIIINRPEAKNAFSPERITLWREALHRSRADQNNRVIVVTGNGDTFCSGGDIRDMAEDRLRSWDMKSFLLESPEPFSKSESLLSREIKGGLLRPLGETVVRMKTTERKYQSERYHRNRLVQG